MDEDDVANQSYAAQHINDLLRCPICLDKYRTPKLLPCQHTFCQSPCLEQLIDRFHHIKCPECRVDHRVPYAGVSAFPTNRTLQNFLDLPVQHASQLQRTLNQTQATTNSTESGADGGFPPNENQSQPSGNQASLNTLQASSTSQNGCLECSNQVTLSRCAHCNVVLCDYCKRSHVEQLRLDINRLVSQLRRGVPRFSDAVSVIESKSEQLHQRAEAGKAEITETIERYISELRNRQRLLHSEVQMWLLGEIRSLRMLQENVEVELASTASFCDSTESVLSRPNTTIPDEDLVDLKRQCVEHMAIIRTYEDGSGIRLPRERRVEITFEGNRFSQAISSFGELSITERDEVSSSSDSNGVSDPQSITSVSSSSRESSPAVASGIVEARENSPHVVTMGGITTRDISPAGPDRATAVGRDQPTLDTALMAIGRSSRVQRNDERSAGLLGTDGFSNAAENLGQTTRATPRERLAGLMGGSGAGIEASPSPCRRERPSDVAGGQATSNNSVSGNNLTENVRRQMPQNLSWELPLDFAYPPRTNIRVGNGNQSNTNTRRSLRERRRHNLSDSRLLNNLGATGRQEADSAVWRQRNISGGQRNQTSSQNVLQQEDVPCTNSNRPSPPVRSRTFTREEFRAIREEETASRASSADSISRNRDSVMLNLDSTIDASANDETFRVTAVDGGESVRVNISRNNYQDKGRSIIRFGCRGSNESEFVWPRGVTVSRSDHIYVADSSNHRVQVFDNIGTYIKSFGSYGQGDGEFDCLAGITMNTMGDFLITDRYNHRVQVFDSNGHFTFAFGEEGNGEGQMSYPWGIACDSMGFIYICDKENHRIQVFQSNGVFARKFGRLGRQKGQFENPHYIAISLDNRVYVSDSSNHRIQVFSMYGDYIFQFGSIGTMQGQMKYPKGIAIDDQGFVVVADSGNNRIQVFRGDGRFYCMFGSYGSDNGQFKGLEGLAVLGNGNVVVSDRENHRIQIF